MRWHALIWLLAALLLSGRADSRGFGNNYTGVGNNSAAAGGGCAGVIDFSTGCMGIGFGGM